MRPLLAGATALALIICSADVSAQSSGKRLFDLVRDKVEEKAKERVAHELGVDDPNSPISVEVDDEISTRHRTIKPRVRYDPIGAAQVVTMRHDESFARGMVYPEDHNFIPNTLEGYTHVRVGAGQWYGGSLAGIPTCDPQYIVRAKAGKPQEFDELSSVCTHAEGRIIGGRKIPNPNLFSIQNAGASREEVLAAYQERVSVLNSTDKYYFRGAGHWLDVEGGVVLRLSESIFTDNLGVIEGPHFIGTQQSSGIHEFNHNTLAFFIPLTPEEKESQRGPKFNSASDYFNPNLSTVFYQIKGVRPCKGGRYLVHVVVDEVRYYLGNDLNAPFRAWKPGSPQTQANGLPLDTRVYNHTVTPEQLCPPVQPGAA